MAHHHTRQKAISVMSIGILLIAFGGIANHYSAENSPYHFWIGALYGLGISLIVFGLAKADFKKPAAKK